MFALDPMGDKETLLRRVEKLLFDNYLFKRQGDEELREISDIEIETMIKSAQIQFDSESERSFQDWRESIRAEKETLKILDAERIICGENNEWPWEVVKEIGRQNRRFTYLEIHRAMAQFMRPNMVFYNHTLEGETLTAVVAFPYTPDMLYRMSEAQLFAFSEAANIISDEERAGETNIIIPILRQRLLDAIYAVQDAPRMHSVFPCQSKFKICRNIASGLENNYLCKLCCQEDPHRIASIIHDDHDQFFRYKYKLMAEFEQKFDRSRTIRLGVSRLVKLYELKKIFEKYDVIWEEVDVFYSPDTERIEYIYIILRTKEEAIKVMHNPRWITSTLKRFNTVLRALPNDLTKAVEYFPEPENVLVLIKPSSYLEVVAELPQGPLLLDQLKNLIKIITRLEFEEFTIEPDQDPITKEPDYTQIFVVFPNRSFVNKVYDCQPFFGSVIAHKLSHLQPTHFLRFSRDACMMCPEDRDPDSIWDMCVSCSARQKAISIIDPASVHEVTRLIGERKAAVEARGGEASICSKCPNIRDPTCPNKLCLECYRVQAVKTLHFPYEESQYWNELKHISPAKLARKLMAKVGEMHLEVREDLKYGRYDWFKPIYGTSIEGSMMKANRELQEVIDNGHLIRGHAPKKFMKDGKIFTFQANQPFVYWVDRQEFIREDIDSDGKPYIEYCYGDTEQDKSSWTKMKDNEARSFDVVDCNLYTSAPNLLIKQNFHVMLFGLGKESLKIKELYQEISIKMKTHVGELDIKSIMILDNLSILSDILISTQMTPQLDKNLRTLGRVALVQFKNILDGLSLLSGLVKVSLPLADGSIGEPFMAPSTSLLHMLQNMGEDQSLPFQGAGRIFSSQNKLIEKASMELKSILTGGGGDKGGLKRRRKGGKGRKPFNKGGRN